MALLAQGGTNTSRRASQQDGRLRRMQFGSSGPYVPRNTQDFSVAVPSQFPPVNSSAANRPRQATRTPNRFHLPSGIFWWMFMIGLTLWVVLLFVIHLKASRSDAYFVRGTAGADVSGTEPWQDLHVFHVEAQMDGSTEDDQENLASFTYFNVSEHKQNEIVKDDNPLPYDDDNFVMPVSRESKSYLFLQDADPSIMEQLIVKGPKGFHITFKSAKKGKEGILDAMGRKASGPAGSVTFSNLQRQYAQQLASRHAKAYAAVGNRPLQVNDAGAIGQAKAEQQRQEPKHQDGKGEGEGQNPEKGDEQAEQVHGVTKSQQQGPDDQRRPNETISAAVAKENLVTGLPTDPPKVPRDSPVGEVAQGFRASVVKTNLSEMELFQGYLSRNRLGKERGYPYKKYPSNGKPNESTFLYGQTIRWSARSDVVDAVKMEPRPAAVSQPGEPLPGRVGCPRAAQPLRLVPEFSAYVFKHFAAAPAGRALRYVHMGSIVPLPTGNLLVAFQGSQLTEGAEDQRVYLSLSRDGDVGRRWSDPLMFPVRARGAQWGPVLHVHPQNGNVWMFYTESSNPLCLREATEKFPPRFAPGGDVVVSKTRDGIHWSEPHRIFRMSAEGGTPKVIANNVHVSKAGTWMLPFWRESHYFNSQTPCHTSTGDGHGVLISRDDGLTWAARGNLTMDKTHLYEGTLADLGDGSVIMVFRTQLGAAAVSRSMDDGETWSYPLLLTADNPDSKPNLINIWPNGEVLMAFNDHTKENIACKNCRSKLSISRLVNATGAWDHVAQFGPSPSDFLKVHYPSMSQHGCRLLVVYSSMYACCAPFHEFCECAPAGAEVGLIMVSYKIWEDGKSATEQLADHKMRMMSRKALSEHLWGNNWWSTYHPQSEFTNMLMAKVAESPSLSLKAYSRSSGSIGDPKSVALPAPGSDALQRAKVWAQANSSKLNELQ